MQSISGRTLDELAQQGTPDSSGCPIILSYTQKPPMEISTQITIQNHNGFWYQVEDIHTDVGCFGCTISYWEEDSERGDKRHSYICMNKEEALAIADAIYKLFKN